MFAGDIAATQRGEADMAGLARTGDAVAAAVGDSVEFHATPLRCLLAEQDGGAGWGIDLHAVMHLDDLDVPVLAERRRHLAGQAGQDVDAEAARKSGV